jgi:ribosomal protein S18 acetylase RimI-like enzyme
MSATIRGASADDETAVIDLWRRCGLAVSHNDPATDFRFARNGPSSDVLVADDTDSRIVGSVMVGHDGHRGWLYYVAVDPTCRRQGLGRFLVAAAEQWLVACGIAKAQLMVRETNGDVVRFYECLGYDPMPRINLQKWLRKP